MNFTILNQDQIIRVISCPAHAISSQLETDETYVQGRYPAHLFDYVNGEMVSSVKTLDKPLTQAEQQAAELKENGYLMPASVELTDANGAYALVNLAVSRACEKYVSPGKFMNFIYLFKEQSVRAWIDAGSVEADAPELLKSWFDNSSFATLADAANSILNEADFMRSKIEALERLRLEARAAILAANSDYESIINPYITAIENI